jgi:hypothetical protein
MSQAKQEELTKVRESLKLFREREQALARELGEDPTPDISATHQQESEDASLFHKMSSAELLHLYRTDKAAWRRVMDSVESEGLRKLFGRK